MLTFTKIDSPKCKAKITALRVIYENDNKDYFLASIGYYENGLRLFSDKTKIVRTTELDAINDAIKLANENNFA